MEFKAIHRGAPMSGRKARPVVALVQGLNVNDALEALEYMPQRAAPMLSKVIRSAIANAGQTEGIEANDLRIKHAVVNDGPLKQGRLRFRPAPMGRAMPIRKRTCHIEVVLETAESAGGGSRRRAAAEASAADVEGDTGSEQKKD